MTDLKFFLQAFRSLFSFYAYFCPMLQKYLFPLVCLLLFPFAASSQVAWGALAVDAAQRYDDGDYDGVVSLLRNIDTEAPACDAAYYYLGLSYVCLNDLDSAEVCLKKAATLDPSNYWYRYRLARLYSLMGNTELTLGMYEELLADFPKKNDLHYELVNLYLYESQPEKALEAIDEIENIGGKNETTVMARHSILAQQGRNEEAYQTLIDYNRDFSSPQILSMLGDYEMGMYEDSTALAYYSEALSLDDTYAPAKLGLAETYRITRRYGDFFRTAGELMSDPELSPTAKADYLEALVRNADPRFLRNHRNGMDSLILATLSVHPSDTSVIQTAGLYYYASGRSDEAVDCFRRGTELNPQYFSSWANYVSVLNETEEWVAMEQACMDAYKALPDNPEFLDMALTAQYYQDNWRDVIATSELLIRLRAGDDAAKVSYLTNIGDMYHNLGQSSTAYKYYEQALKIDPSHNPALNNYAYFLSLEGKNLNKAYKMSKATIETEPDNATYLDTFGWILHLMGKDLEAKPFFKHAMLYGGKESATVLEHYSIVLEALGETDLARVYANQAKAKAAEEGNQQ